MNPGHNVPKTIFLELLNSQQWLTLDTNLFKMWLYQTPYIKSGEEEFSGLLENAVKILKKMGTSALSSKIYQFSSLIKRERGRETRKLTRL